MTVAVFNASYGVPTKVETDTTIYLFVRYDISENEADFTAYRTSRSARCAATRSAIRSRSGLIRCRTLPVTMLALKRYTPEKIKI